MADGGRIAASGPSEFVRLLREGSWFDSGCTDGEYMVNFSGRYRELHGVTVRTDTPEHFMDDLKSTVTSRVERPVPLLLRSLPVHSSPVGIFSFSRYLISAVSCFPEAGFTTSFLNHFFSFHTAINGLSYFYTQSRQYREESRALAGLPFVISFAGIDYLCLYMTITDKVFPHTFTLFSLRRRTTIRHRERPPDQTPGYHMELMYKSEVMVMDSIERNPQIRIISTGRRCRIYVAAKGSYLNRISGDRKEVAPTRTFHHRSESKKAITEKR